MIDNEGEKIIIKNCAISKDLFDEIIYARENLQKAEEKKNSGRKKNRITFIDASHRLGKMLREEYRGISKRRIL